MSSPLQPLTQQLQRMAAASRALGVAAAPPVAPLALPRNLQFVEITVSAAKQIIAIPGDYIYVYSIAYGTTPTPVNATPVVFVQPDSGAAIPLADSRFEYAFPIQFTQLQFEAEGPLAAPTIVLQLFVGFGRIRNDRNNAAAQLTTGDIWHAGNEFTRPNNVTPYAAGQVVSTAAGQAISFGSIFSQENGFGYLVKARLEKSGGTVANASFRLYLFLEPPTAPADQTNYVVPYAGAASMIGAIVDFPIMFTEAGAGAATAQVDLRTALYMTDDMNLYGILVAEAAYVPAAQEQFAVTLWVDRYHRF